MKVLACVTFGERTVQTAWEAAGEEDDPYLVVREFDDGTLLAIPLSSSRLQELNGLAVADKAYLGDVNVTNAVLITRTTA
ncbi:hypothetical protein SBV1_1690003 [Verrucomicrobia bacterium]|nr:hypothetical protein SBV1_1690003 [Verrucomicrobiota bacterium]